MKAIVCCLLMLLLCPPALLAQNTGADSVGIHLVKHLRAADGEEVHLETDRNIYAAGETIWFTALLVDELNHKMDTSSKNLFVDLVTANDSVVSKLVMDAVQLRTSGAITLGDSLPTGQYWFRCYTRNIILNNPEAAYIKPLYVVNRQSSSAAPNSVAVTKNTNAVIHFYPEGGALITGMASGGALQVTDEQGNPVIADGKIVADKDSVVATFTTNRFGLAKVSFYPVWYKKYTAIIQYRGKDVSYGLPAYNGYATQVSVAGVTGQTIQVHVALEDSIYSRRFVTYLLAVNRDHVYYASVGHGMYTADIPAGNLPNGITTLLLYNDKQQLLSSRNIFIQKPAYTVNMTTDKNVYSERENVALKIGVKDGAGNPLVAAINIAVQDNKIMQVCDEMNDDSIMPPTAKLQNEWLYKYAAALPAQDVDLFMQARQAAYQYKLSDSIIKTLQADTTDVLRYIKGIVTNKQKRPLQQKVVTVMPANKGDIFYDADTTSADGKFEIPIPANAHNVPVMVQVANKNGAGESQDLISIESFKFPVFATPLTLKKRYYNINTLATQQLAKYTNDTFYNYIGKGWLKPVVVTAVTKVKPNYDESKRLSPFSHLVTSDKFGHSGQGIVGNSLLTVPGVSLRGGKVVTRGGFGFSIAEPLLVVDGTPVRDPGDSTSNASFVMGYLNSMDYEAIDFIEVLEGPEAAIYGSRGANGVISVITKYPDNNNAAAGFKIFNPVTYHSVPPFVMPDYADKKIKASKLPDPRTTIYWKGNLFTGKDGEATVNFFAGDGPATYTVIVTGITQNGEYIYKRMNINIK